MRRVLAIARGRGWMAAALALVGAAMAAAPAGGFFVGDYAGTIKGDPATDILFNVARTDAGHRKVTGFIASNLTFECEAQPDGRTEALRIKHRFPVREGEFQGSGEAVGIPLDPTGRVKGEFRPNDKAGGTVRLFGEFAGKGSECDTGVQEWRATKTDF